MSTDIRPAIEEDLPALGRLGAILLKVHNEFDRTRFLAPDPEVIANYAEMLRGLLGDGDINLLVAERDGDVVGYIYAAIEEQSLKERRPKAGVIHDVAVDQSRRGEGVAVALIGAALAWFRERSAPCVMLWTAERNAGAQQLFLKLGFRRTMVEMAREL